MMDDNRQRIDQLLDEFQKQAAVAKKHGNETDGALIKEKQLDTDWETKQ